MPTASGHTIAIGASRVIGTDVLDARGVKIGAVEEIVLDKTSNAIMFAVVNLGGALVTGSNYRALPWSALDYDESKEAYLVGRSLEEVAKGPSHSMVEDLIRNDAAGAREAAYSHYGVTRDW